MDLPFTNRGARRKLVHALLCGLVALTPIGSFAAMQTLPATELRSYCATLNGQVNPEGKETLAWFEWGATTNYGQATPPQNFSGTTNSVNFGQIITNLTIEVTYHFRAVASNTAGVSVGTNQSFITPDFSEFEAGLPAYLGGSAAWADANNDGLLDLLLTGFGGQHARLWRNTGSGFVPTEPMMDWLDTTAVAWGDYDNDGLADVLITGYSYGRDARIAEIWRNTGGGFSNLNLHLPGVFIGSVAWLDFDRDGNLDLAIAGNRGGFGPGGQIASILKHTAGGFLDLNFGLPGVWWCAVACGDYDNDGRADFFLAGQKGDGTRIADVWHNTGAGFTNLNLGLPQLGDACAAWGDYDNDGWLDLLVCGETTTDQVSQVWHNTGTGFTNLNANLNGVRHGDAAWGDYDNDGKLDILLENLVFRNTGYGFVRTLEMPMPYYTASAWGDYDNDGRLDIVFSSDAYFTRTYVFHNNTPRTNTPPLPPANLSAVVTGGTATFTWTAGSDAETPAAGLTYSLRIGTTPGGCDIVSPLAAPDGRRLVPQMGNVQMARSYQLVNLPLNRTIYWSVQSVDTAFAGSAFAPEQSFHLTGYVSPVAGPVAGDLNGDGVVNDADLGSLLQTYWTNQPPVISGFRRLGSNQFEFSLTNLTALDFVVNASTNLTDWQSLGPAAVRYQFTDTNAAALPQRNYRLRWP